MIVVFDLDDTLYPEITYVYSGFRAVAQYLEAQFQIPNEESYAFMQKSLAEQGRGRVFNDVLHQFGLETPTNVRKCLTAYRQHHPDIQLPTETLACLERLTALPLYVVTDGNKLVQHNKLQALGLYHQMRHCYVTHRYGIQQAKPSPYCFQQIAKREKAQPGQIVYIADNPNKDFVGIKPLGFRTIRIRQGCFQALTLHEHQEAEHEIPALSLLTLDFLQEFFAAQPQKATMPTML